MIDELDAEHLDLMVLFKAAHIDMIALCDIQKDAIDKEEESLNVQELAPAETQIKEELG